MKKTIWKGIIPFSFQPISLRPHRDPMTTTENPISQGLNVRRPERPETTLQSGKSENVRPGLTSDDGAQSSSVDASELCNLSDAAAGHRVVQVDNEPARDLSDFVIAGHQGPIDAPLGRSSSFRARTHAPSIQLTKKKSKVSQPKFKTGATLTGSNYGEQAEEVIASLKDYTPQAATKKEWAHVQTFVEDAVIRSSRNVTGARQMLRITAVYVLWCAGERGLPLQPDVIFAPLTIDAYCNQAGLSEGTRGTYRSTLMRVSATLVPEANPPAMTPVQRRTVQAPYSASELTRYRAWASGQHTLNNRQKARVMLALSAGAGLWPAEIDALLRQDIVADADGVVVMVRGDNPRQVPVLREWEEWLLEVADTREPGQPIFGTVARSKDKSLLNAFTTKTVGAAPTNARLRATWIVTHIARATPMRGLFRAGGFKQFSNLHQYLPFVDDLDISEYRALLRGGVSE
jgi:hypothetical protein